MYPTPTLTVSNIRRAGLSHSSVNIQYDVSAATGTGWCQILFGLSSGNYTYAVENAATYTPPNGSDTSNGCQINMQGLAPGTTYYASPTVRTSASNTPWTANVCQQGGSCGATEQTFTTAALPAVHPAPPTAPTTWIPAEPNTTGYTVVAMQAATGSGTDSQGRTYVAGDCVASSPGVSIQTNWLHAVVTNDTVQTVVSDIWFDTVLEWAEGSACNIPQAGSGSFYEGVTLPVYSPAGGSNDWVMFRTHQNAAGDFPPFGTRTGPQYKGKLASLKATTPGLPANVPPCTQPSCQGQNFNGSFFSAAHRTAIISGGKIYCLITPTIPRSTRPG